MTSPIGWPAARASSTPSTEAPVLYIHRSPGWAISGSEPSAVIQASGSGWTSGLGGPKVPSGSSPAATTTGSGVGPNMSNAMPKPMVKVSRCLVVIGRTAGTVSSTGPSSDRSTWRPASSGSSLSTGSSRPIRPSSISAIAVAAAIGLVVDAMRNSESLATGGPPIVRLP